MKRGGNIASVAAIISLAACGGEQGKLQVRPLPTPLAQGAKPVSFRIAEAHGQMALGNVALALESYRKAVREDPNSAEAQAGIAVAYDKMGRFDLSRRYYEAALAIEPANTGLLETFAASLDMQGKRAEANSVRAEIALRKGAARPQLATDDVQVDPAPVAVASSGIAKVPTTTMWSEPEPLAPYVSPAKRPTTEPVQVASTPVAVATNMRTRVPTTKIEAEPEPLAPYVSPRHRPEGEALQIASAPVAVASSVKTSLPQASYEQEADAPPPQIVAESGRSVTVTLPPPRPVLAKVVEPAAPMKEQAPPVAIASVALPPKEGARLERLSMTEVALVTTDKPQWRPTIVAQTQRMATVKFVPLRQTGVRNASVILLNAARHAGLAARTRSYLVDRGWRSLAIGDANRTRSTSLVLYPASRRNLGLRVAAQFGFAAAPHESAKEVMVLLGRDAAARPLRTRG